MDEYNQTAQVRHAVDTRLSGLQGYPYLAQRVLAYVKDTKPVKKKLSVGLILALVVMLLAVGAAAAVLLSMRQIVDEQAIPMANQYEGELYTAEDTNILVTLAAENEIELSQQTKAQIQQALDQGEGYFKEEMLMALAKAEFGDNPTVWTLEEQKWFDDVCVAIGFITESEKAMPTGGKEEKDPIVMAANDYIHNTYESDAPLDDPSEYEIGVQYVAGGPGDEYEGLFWMVIYFPQTLEGAQYCIYLQDNGTVLGDFVRPGIEADSTVSDIRDSYVRVYGSEHTWEQSTLRAFKASAELASDTNNQAYLCFLQTTYPDLPESAISQAQAYAIAAADLGVDLDIGRSQLFLIGDDPNPVWKLYIAQDDNYWSIEVDCITGEIKTMRLLDNTLRRWWMRMVLWKVSDEVEENWVDDSPPAVGLCQCRKCL